MTTPDPVQVAYDVLEDAMTPAAGDSNYGGYWLSELPPDLLAQRIAAAYGMAGLLLPNVAAALANLLDAIPRESRISFREDEVADIQAARDALEAAILHTDTTETT